MKIVKLVVAGIVLVLPGVVSAAAFIYNLGFDTAEEQAAWSIIAHPVYNTSIAGNGPAPSPLYSGSRVEIADANGPKVNGTDSPSRTGNLYLTRKFDAPAGFVFDDVGGGAFIWSNANYGSLASIALSANGVDFVSTPNAFGGRNASLDLASDVNFNEIPSLWVRLNLYDNLSYYATSDGGLFVRIENVSVGGNLVAAVPEPDALAIASLGGLTLLHRRRVR